MEVLALLQRLISCFKFGPEAAQQDRDFVFKGQLEPSSSICSFFRRFFFLLSRYFGKEKPHCDCFMALLKRSSPRTCSPGFVFWVFFSALGLGRAHMNSFARQLSCWSLIYEENH